MAKPRHIAHVHRCGDGGRSYVPLLYGPCDFTVAVRDALHHDLEKQRLGRRWLHDGPETMLYALLAYTFISILLVVVQLLGLYVFPREMIFFNDPYLPSLILLPASLAASLFAVFFKKSMPAYKEFSTRYGGEREKGYFGLVVNRETDFQSETWCVSSHCSLRLSGITI